jgi:NADH-quinone oxidoreductase subunit J
MDWILGSIILLSSLGVILARKPVYSGLSFLLMLITLSLLYLQLSAQFIAVMQVLVYAGAILVVFMFVIVLFQDAHYQIAKLRANSASLLLWSAALLFLLALVFWLTRLPFLTVTNQHLPEGYGTVETLGKALYLDFFFPFEAVILLFLVAVVGAVYTGKKEIT